MLFRENWEERKSMALVSSDANVCKHNHVVLYLLLSTHPHRLHVLFATINNIKIHTLLHDDYLLIAFIEMGWEGYQRTCADFQIHFPDIQIVKIVSLFRLK